MNEVLLELYRHKTWATLRLIEHCQSLDDAQLDATIPGTYGTIRDTLRHLVGAEERYFWEVTGNRLAEPFPDGPVPLAELAGRIRRFVERAGVRIGAAKRLERGADDLLNQPRRTRRTESSAELANGDDVDVGRRGRQYPHLGDRRLRVRSGEVDWLLERDAQTC
jgi:uncharacterized damage-inducible protein DinB